jgi:hypothetical protein
VFKFQLQETQFTMQEVAVVAGCMVLQMPAELADLVVVGLGQPPAEAEYLQPEQLILEAAAAAVLKTLIL